MKTVVIGESSGASMETIFTIREWNDTLTPD